MLFRGRGQTRSLISGCGMLFRGRGKNFCVTVPELSLGKLATMGVDLEVDGVHY